MSDPVGWKFFTPPEAREDAGGATTFSVFTLATCAHVQSAPLMPYIDHGRVANKKVVQVHKMQYLSLPTSLTLWGSTLATAILAVVFWDLSVGFILLPAAIIIALITVSMSAFIVKIDDHGIAVNSIVGFPKYWFSRSDIVRASSQNVSPIRDFGGWGVRLGGRTQKGVILKKGPALFLDMKDGSSFAVTLENADLASDILS